jgi:uncharacterized protein (TIGR00369 family)
MTALPDLENTGAFLQALGLTLTEVSGRRVLGHAELSHEHDTPWGVVHGGVYTAIIESAASVGASAHVLDHGQFAVGVNNNTDFLRPAPHGRLDVVAEPIHQGRVQQLWHVTLTAEDRLIARGTVRLQNVPLQDT